ncbi:MAG: hypothetical protein WBK28_03530 [Minisyncoccia bacterium]
MDPSELPPVTTGPTGEQLRAFMRDYESVIANWYDYKESDGLNDTEVTMLVDELATKAGGDLTAVTPEMLEEIKGRAAYIVRQKNLPPSERD